eukprot:14653984-Alexandrium_andersonii.AAC.1
MGKGVREPSAPPQRPRAWPARTSVESPKAPRIRAAGGSPQLATGSADPQSSLPGGIRRVRARDRGPLGIREEMAPARLSSWRWCHAPSKA